MQSMMIGEPLKPVHTELGFASAMQFFHPITELIPQGEYLALLGCSRTGLDGNITAFFFDFCFSRFGWLPPFS
jgi:hypothetical protein